MTETPVDANWVTEHGYDRVFGYTGVQQFFLDMDFFLKVCDGFLNDAVKKRGSEASSKALKIYFKRATDTNRVLKVNHYIMDINKFSRQVTAMI
jgi:hypothetical protein